MELDNYSRIFRIILNGIPNMSIGSRRNLVVILEELLDSGNEISGRYLGFMGVVWGWEGNFLRVGM